MLCSQRFSVFISRSALDTHGQYYQTVRRTHINIHMRNFLNVFEDVKPDKLISPTLRYKANQLEPVMSEETVNYHFGELAKGYAKRYKNNLP